MSLVIFIFQNASSFIISTKILVLVIKLRLIYSMREGSNERK